MVKKRCTDKIKVRDHASAVRVLSETLAYAKYVHEKGHVIWKRVVKGVKNKT